MVVEIVLQALWFFIPAYVANPSAVLFGGGTPIDFGRKLKDGKRMFGDGKTWRGFVGGISAGMFIGLLQHTAAYLVDVEMLMFGTGFYFIVIIFLLASGSMLGDLLGSFIKRRLGSERGSKKPVLDMYSFLLGTFVLLLIFQWDWTVSHYFYNWYFIGFITVMIATPLLHRGVNIMGHKMGKKDVPW